MSLIETSSLGKRFNDTEAVKQLNLSVREGACTALLGPNGAGKTTTLNMLTGLMKPTEGTIQFDAAYEGDRRNYLGYLPQYPKFFGWMSGEEYLIFAAELAGLPKKQAKISASEMLELIGLQDDGKKRISGYSGGMKQRLGIAQALVHSPKLIILDEPVSALDPIGRREVLELMKRLKTHTSILFSTHVLHDAEEVSDDIFIMNKGTVVIEGSLRELQQTHQKPAFFLETEKSPEEWLHTLKEQDWVVDWELDHHRLMITVDNMEKARANLLKDEHLHELKLVKFEVAKTSLEDLFMKVIS
ncbi:ABC transporter ATP-binding protein [Salipaludibacillus keqinensis]|uniref:ABC transporter ATP-binding protein n=1 Tax=Salipaludibacillus keqinensis TaxID=2045207 RepID=A0A323TF64_9BACI|nr:ABC transporter ATP-binding protein [Salipaludibacillus keqinensis]PYZ93902.1 ABC transporter ATP-binding protein [Salipaludibacillus keqinensis]